MTVLIRNPFGTSRGGQKSTVEGFQRRPFLPCLAVVTQIKSIWEPPERGKSERQAHYHIVDLMLKNLRWINQLNRVI